MIQGICINEIGGLGGFNRSKSNAKEGIIGEFVSKPIPKNWDRRTLNERRLYWAAEYENDNTETVDRDRICAAEVWCECLGGDLEYIEEQIQ